MKKIVLLALIIVTLSTFSYAAMMPSDALSWVVSVKDGTWIVKGLGAAGGAEGQEAVSWVIDPSGKVTSTGMGELDKECSGCVSAGQLLVNPISGVTDVAMKEAIKSNPELGVVQQFSAVRSELSKLGMSEGEAKFVKREANSTGPTGSAVADATETPSKYNAEDLPELRWDSKDLPYLTKEANKEYINGLYKCVKGTCMFKSEGTEDYIKFKDSKGNLVEYKNIEQGSYFEFSKDYDNTVSKAIFVPTKDGTFNINGQEFKLSAGSNFKVTRSCEAKPCTDSVVISAASQNKAFDNRVGDEVLVDQISKVSFNGKDYAMLSGSKINMDVTKKDDKTSYTLKKDSVIKYSNSKEFSAPQVFDFDNIKFTTDVQRYDSQEGLVKFDGKKLGGTLKSVKTKDGTSINVPTDITQRKTQVTDQMEIELDANDEFSKATLSVKDRHINLYPKNQKDNPYDFFCTDTFFKTKPAAITALGDCYHIESGAGKSLQGCPTPASSKPSAPIKVSNDIPPLYTLPPELKIAYKNFISFSLITPPDTKLKFSVNDVTDSEKKVEEVITEKNLPDPRGSPLFSNEECLNLLDIPLDHPECYLYSSEWKAKDVGGKGEVTIKSTPPPEVLKPHTDKIEESGIPKKAEPIGPKSEAAKNLALPDKLTIVRPTVGPLNIPSLVFYSESEIKDGKVVTNSLFNTKPTYFARPLFSPDKELIVTKPIDNFGVFFPEVKEGGTIYLYRPETTGAVTSFVSHELTKKTVWVNDKLGFEGVLVDKNKAFQIKTGDILRVIPISKNVVWKGQIKK